MTRTCFRFQASGNLSAVDATEGCAGDRRKESEITANSNVRSTTQPLASCRLPERRQSAEHSLDGSQSTRRPLQHKRRNSQPRRRFFHVNSVADHWINPGFTWRRRGHGPKSVSLSLTSYRCVVTATSLFADTDLDWTEFAPLPSPRRAWPALRSVACPSEATSIRG